MKSFLYKARNAQGQVVSGSVKAADSVEAEKVLLANNLVALDITQESQGSKFSLAGIGGGRITNKDKALFARQLATMVGAGLTLAKAIKVVSSQIKKPRLHQVYMDVYKDIEEGLSFSVALSKHPHVFDQVFVSIVNAGEATGNLDLVLEQLADQLENDGNFVAKVRGAMYYPAFIMVALIGIGSYMLVAVIPQLKGIFDQSGATLPLATRMLLSLSDFVTNKWWAVLVIIVLLIVAIKVYFSTRNGMRMWSLIKIKMPIFKKLSEGIYMYRFSRILAMLIGTGVPLLDALKISSSVMNNEIYEESIATLVRSIEKGIPLSVQLSKDPIFPPLVGQMAAVGEETGKLDAVLNKVADYFGESTDQMIKTISTLVEPIVLVIMGIGVAFLVFAVLVPIYNVAQLQ